MDENNQAAIGTKAQDGKTNMILVPYKSEKEQKVVCEVCGHANPENTAICKNCSNYLL